MEREIKARGAERLSQRPASGSGPLSSRIRRTRAAGVKRLMRKDNRFGANPLFIKVKARRHGGAGRGVSRPQTAVNRSSNPASISAMVSGIP